MSKSKNWKAYYSGDFTQYDLTVEGEVQAEKLLTVEPELKESDSPSINPTIFHIKLVNTGDGEFKKVLKVFKVESEKIETVIVFNENGDEEAKVPVTANRKGKSENSSFSGDFSDDFK